MPAGSAMTANGSSQPKVLASTETHVRPKEPGEEIAEAEPPAGSGGREQAAEGGRPAAPSTSQTRIGKVMKGTGQTFVGGSASAEEAPARNAIRRRRHPQASTNRVGEAGERHGRRGDFGDGRRAKA